MGDTMKVLVTGGAGYIGSHAVKALKNSGHQVVVFDNLSKGKREFVKDTALIEGDLRNRHDIDAAFAKSKFESVMHFAAKMEVAEGEADPGLYYENNVLGTINLLESMRHHKVGSIIFSSTAAAYGDAKTIPISEDEPTAPISTYGKTKVMVENILHDFYRSYQMPSVILRYFNAAGASVDGTIGEAHQPESHLIPILINCILHDKVATINGNDYPTPDGTAVRDYIHVMDIAQAHVLALEYAQFEKAHNTFNIGTGHGYSIKQVIETIEQIAGKQLNVKFGPRRVGDQPATYAKVDKIQSTLGWKPQYSDLPTIIQTAYHWHKKHV
jgi:UDP-glucose-4-epimerase GalE